MNIASWVARIVLALVFAGSGLYKGTQPKEKVVASGQTGVRAYSQGFIRFIAIAELFGAAGLILPGVIGVAPLLVPLAALGLAIIMVGAAVSHARLAAQRPREWLNVVTNVVLFAACVVVIVASR